MGMSLGTPRTIFQRYDPGTFMSIAMQNPEPFSAERASPKFVLQV